MSINHNSYVYQHGTLGGLMEDLMDGTVPIKALLAHGTDGIGTLAGSNGEVIFLDGLTYHVDESGKVKQLSGSEMTPYSAVTTFVADNSFSITKQTTAEDVKKAILETISPNLFAGVKIRGTFSKMHVRVSPKQVKPYPKFVEIIKNQPEFKTTDVKGTIVGFFTPKLFHGASVAGFHLHFISDDQTFAGHILDFELKNGEIETMEEAELRQHFPVDNKDYLTHEIDVARVQKDIEKAE